MSNVYACAVLLVALSPHRVCCLKRLGYAVFVELYVGEFNREVVCLENRWSAGISAIGDVCCWADVRRFHDRRDLESYQCGDAAANV